MNAKAITLKEVTGMLREWEFHPRRTFVTLREVYDYACVRAYGAHHRFWQNYSLPSGYGRPVVLVKSTGGNNCGPRIIVDVEWRPEEKEDDHDDN